MHPTNDRGENRQRGREPDTSHRSRIKPVRLRALDRRRREARAARVEGRRPWASSRPSEQITQEVHQQAPKLIALARGKDIGAVHRAGEDLQGFRLRRSLIHGLDRGRHAVPVLFGGHEELGQGELRQIIWAHDQRAAGGPAPGRPQARDDHQSGQVRVRSRFDTGGASHAGPHADDAPVALLAQEPDRGPHIQGKPGTVGAKVERDRAKPPLSDVLGKRSPTALIGRVGAHVRQHNPDVLLPLSDEHHAG